MALILRCILATGAILFAAPAMAKAVPPPAVEVHLQHFGFSGQAGAYTPDGRFLLWGAGYGGSVTLWDIGNRQLVRTFIGIGGSEVKSIAVSADGQYFVAGADGGSATVFRIATGERVSAIPGTDGSVDAVAFSPDGRYVAAGDDDSHLVVLDTTTGKTASHQEEMFGFVALKFDEDSSDLIAITTAGDIERFKPKDLSLVAKTAATDGTISAAAFIPGSTKVVVGPYDGEIATWDYAKKAQVASFAGGALSNTWFAISPDGSKLLTPADTADDDKDGAILWDVAKGTEIRQVDLSMFQPTLSLDGEGVLDAGLNGIAVMSLADGSQTGSYAVPQSATLSGLSADGSIAYLELDNRHVALQTATGAKFDRTMVADADHLRTVEYKDGTATVIDAVTGAALGSTRLKSPMDYPTTARAADGKTEVATRDGHTTVIPIDSPGDSYEVPNLGDLDMVAIARNAKIVATAIIGTDSHVELHSLPSGKLMRRLPMMGGAYMAFSPDDRQLLAADLDGGLALYQVISGAKVMALKQAWRPMTVGFSEDGKYFYENCDSGLTLIFDHATGKNVLSYQAESAASLTRFLADGKTVLLGYSDGVKFVDIASGALLAERIFYVDGSSRMLTPEGFYDGPPNPKEIRLVQGTDVFLATVADTALNRPDLVAAKLAGDPGGIVAAAAAKLDLASLIAGRPPLGASGAPAKAIPSQPTHVVIAAATVRASADANAAGAGDLAPGTQVAVIEDAGGWSFVARNGSALGYVESKALAPLQ